MQSSYSPPPIPTPDDRDVSLPVASVRGDWASAPKVVRNWAYQLTWLGMVASTLFMILDLALPRISIDEAEHSSAPSVPTVFFAALIVLNIWLNRALKSSVSAAWPAQIVASCLGLLGFPLGTLIHGYILSQWFKPETKAWFGRS